jgi:hypothetical protein
MNVNSVNTNGKKRILGSRRTLDGSGDELVGQLDHRLHRARYQTSPGSAANEECGNQRHGKKHVRCGIGERDLSIANLGDREQIADLELMNGIYYSHGRWSFGSLSRTIPASSHHVQNARRRNRSINTINLHGENVNRPQRVRRSGFSSRSINEISWLTRAIKPQRDGKSLY